MLWARYADTGFTATASDAAVNVILARAKISYTNFGAALI